LEKQREEHDRERHEELYDEWVGAEDKFHLDNAKARSLIRIEQGRERPIDLVVKALAIAGGQEFDDMTILDKPPHQMFASLGLTEVEEMLSDIELNLKSDLEHRAFWKAMLFACQEAIESKQREKSGGPGFGAGVADGVVAEIHELLSSKGKSELEDMLIEIKGNLQRGGEGMDTQFFEAVAAKIPLFMAHAEINRWHEKAQEKAGEWVKANEPQRSPDASSKIAAGSPARDDAASEGEWDDMPGGPAPGSPDAGDISPILEPLSALEEQRGDGACSPILEPLASFDEQDLLDPEEDERIMRQVRQTLIDAFCEPGSGGAAGSTDNGLDRSKEDAWLASERARGMAQGEAAFNATGKGEKDEFHGEISLPRRHYEWEDKYRPRKPRFFNRVKTGYEWNKYNQTHYDHDNPPPKRVQGYKFNIFYPDLIDKTKAPSYYLEKDEESAETVTLRFHAGPPYEDVAFKIVNCEWNLSHKFGFRVVFDRGVLQLYFNFKRWRYRR